MKMNLSLPLLLMLLFALLCKVKSSIKCFKCLPSSSDPKDPLCRHFSGDINNATYQTDCEHSNMCYKKVITHNFGNDRRLTKVEERGCAQQHLEGDQVRTKNGWRPSHEIREVYTEACTEIQYDEERIPKTLECYCRGDLCNSTHKLTLRISIMLIGVIACLAIS